MPAALRRLAKRVLRTTLSWASVAAIPLGIILGLTGWMTLGALLVLGGVLAYCVVDPILMLLDLMPEKHQGRGTQGGGARR
jgi:predicted MFS family arabinose efflux permease